MSSLVLRPYTYICPLTSSPYTRTRVLLVNRLSHKKANLAVIFQMCSVGVVKMVAKAKTAER